MPVEITPTQGELKASDGTIAATVTKIDVGGGTRMVEGEEQRHPTSVVYHVRKHSRDPLTPDELVETSSWDEAVGKAKEYLDRVEEFLVHLRRLQSPSPTPQVSTPAKDTTGVSQPTSAG
jgi:hypothetical protein